VPVVSFAGAYLGLGAAVALEIDRGELGRQAGEMATIILKGGEPPSAPAAWPRRTSIKANHSILKNLDIDTDWLVTHSAVTGERP
jgi:putative ABC transport system substrate-binding protein